MNTFKFLFIDDQKKKHYADRMINDPTLVIDDVYVISILEQLGISNITHWITVLEALLGIVLFAMFVNALYLRYKD